MKFPTPQNEFPKGSKVDRLKPAIGSTGLELNCTVISGPHSNGKSDYYMVKDPNGQTNRVFPDEMRCRIFYAGNCADSPDLVQEQSPFGCMKACFCVNFCYGWTLDVFFRHEFIPFCVKTV